MSADPHPELRCRCIHRSQWTEPLLMDMNRGPDSFYDRCHHQATAEDGMCDHCRQAVTDDGCPDCGPDWRACCRRTDQWRGVGVVGNPAEPCRATPAQMAEMAGES